jgi:hypothetical protein
LISIFDLFGTTSTEPTTLRLQIRLGFPYFNTSVLQLSKSIDVSEWRGSAGDF